MSSGSCSEPASGRQAPLTRWPLAAVALVLVLTLALSLGTLAVSAQQAPDEGESVFDIVSAAHNPAGVLTVTIAVTDVSALQAERFNAFVDGVPAEAQARSAEESDPLSIVIAVDTSGSMRGTPLASAKEAALQLIDQLDERDEVAVVAFASQPEVLSRFTSDREETREVLSSLVAEGDTALYQAVATAASLFARDDAGPSILVLLSDGQDFGEASSITREGSIDAVRDGLTVYSFGLGAGADLGYLGEVSEVSGGQLWEVASSRSLGALFEELGTRLGATFTVDIAVPPLALGEHALTVRSRTETGAAEASFVFNVSNEGLLTAEVLVPEEPGDLIAIELQGAVPLNNLSVKASARGEPLAFAAADRILVDPWAFEPGNVAITIAASVSGQPAAQLTVAATIPALPPMLEVERDDRGETAELVVIGRAQGGEPATISVIVDGEEVATTQGPQLRIPLPQSGDIVVRLARDTTIAERSFSLTPPVVEEAASRSLWPLVAAAAAVVAAGFAIARRRRPRRPALIAPRATPGNREIPVPRGEPAEKQGTLLVRGPNGTERRFEIGRRPMTIGSDPECDIVLQGESVRPLHARITARGSGAVQIHAIGRSNSRPYESEDGDEWLVVRAGEEITIGEQSLMVEE